MVRRACVLLVLALAVAWPAAAQAPVTIGEHVETLLETAHPYLSSGSEKPEVTWTDRIDFRGATYIAVHFAGMELAEGDFVVVRSPDGQQRWTYTRFGRHDLGATPDGFFATHVKGDSAVVELHTIGDTSAYGFRIDLFGRGYNNEELELFWDQGLGEEMNIPYPPLTGRSLCTDDDSLEAVCYQGSEPDAYTTARAVARIVKNGLALCTGWLIGDEGHLMTNEHCITSQADLDNMDFEFMAEGPTCETDCRSPLACPGVIEASGGAFITDSYPLDYALVVPDTSTANTTDLPATYGFIQIRAAGATVGERIYIPQHPAGWGKRLALESSYPAETDEFARVVSLTEPPPQGGPDDVGYWADTQQGSSGSPVLGYDDNLVVALHHYQGLDGCASGGSSDDPNRGVPIEAVIADLDTLLPRCAVREVQAASALTAAPAGDNQVDLVWTASPDAAAYNVYRAFGACPQEAWELVAGGVAGTSWSDTDVSGGTTYAYAVKALEANLHCESPASNCDDAEATGLCTRAPSFAGLESASNEASETCGVLLTWSAATTHCGVETKYNVYRSTEPGFTPDAGNLLAACHSATSYLDQTVDSHTTQLYAIRAEDDSGNGSGPCLAGNEDDNSVVLSATATGPDTLFLTDDLESGTAAWSTAAGENDTGGYEPWTLVETDSHSPTHSWYCSEQEHGEGTSKDQVVQLATTVDLISAPAGLLEFWHFFDTESGFDGGVLEYSVDGGTSWHDILASDMDAIPDNPDRLLANGYNDTLSTCCSNPLPGRSAWSGESPAWSQVQVDLTDFSGEQVLLRWRFGCDESGASGYDGWYVDDVRVLRGSSCSLPEGIFADGFESGDLSGW